MIKRKFADIELPLLGLGTMRLPLMEGNDGRIDMERASEMVKYAMEHGVNYFDTAWGYHEGTSEQAVGELLSDYPRESYFLASKFPGYDLDNMPRVKEIFTEQLKRCRTDYFDLYMLHNVCETNINEYLDESFGIMEYLRRMKKEGKIRHLGFSAHGNPDTLKRFLDAYGDDMEFCQLQLNYIDMTLQDGAIKLKMMEDRGIAVLVMEPVRGGSLAALPEEQYKKLRALRPDDSAAKWAFRYLKGLPNVCLILSGMSDMAQLKENIGIFEKEDALDAREAKLLSEVSGEMLESILPCTACRYCASYCPQQLDIPMLLKLSNDYDYSGGSWLVDTVIDSLPEDKRPDSCIGCGSCEAVCPQKIDIAAALEGFAQKLKNKE